MRNLGLVLVIIGIVMMIFTGFNYVTKKNVVDIGPVEINKNVNHSVQWPPIIGGVLLVAGFVLILSGKNKSS